MKNRFHANDCDVDDEKRAKRNSTINYHSTTTTTTATTTATLEKPRRLKLLIYFIADFMNAST